MTELHFAGYTMRQDRGSDVTKVTMPKTGKVIKVISGKLTNQSAMAAIILACGKSHS